MKELHTGAAILGAGLSAMSLAGGRWGAVAKVGTQALKVLAISEIGEQVRTI